MMYYKIVGDRMVFDTCKTIRMDDGTWISNPSEEKIAEAGWLPYTPPEPETVKVTEPSVEEVAHAVKKMLAAAAIDLSDEDALDVAAIYPTWASMIGKQVNVGERYWFNGKLYKVIQAHTTQADWEPDDTPALYTDVSIVEIPDWKQPIGSEDAYNIGDKVKYNGKTWESTVDANVWAPGVYGWNEIV